MGHTSSVSHQRESSPNACYLQEKYTVQRDSCLILLMSLSYGTLRLLTVYRWSTSRLCRLQRLNSFHCRAAWLFNKGRYLSLWKFMSLKIPVITLQRHRSDVCTHDTHTHICLIGFIHVASPVPLKLPAHCVSQKKSSTSSTRLRRGEGDWRACNKRPPRLVLFPLKRFNDSVTYSWRFNCFQH